MDDINNGLEQLIGFHTLNRPLESWYAFVSRLIRANLLNGSEVRRQLPLEWIRWAFAPHEVRAEDLVALDTQLAHLPDADLKLRPAAWQLWPDLSSVPPECLRACASCLLAGYHSYAMQCDLIARCPVHHEELTHHCPHCQTPMVWSGRVLGTRAFECPSGCSLIEGIHGGLLVPYEAELSAILGRHAAWLQTLRNSIAFVSGPVYIAYPPHLAVMPGATALPSKGLSTALLQSLLATGIAIPPFKAYHEQAPGRWTVEVQPWRPVQPITEPEFGLEGLRDGFRRGAFRTYIPLADAEAFERWLVLSETKHGDWHGGAVERGSTSFLFRFRSHLITNAELVGLRRLLTSGNDPALACTHYQQVLVEVLERACQRDSAISRQDGSAASVVAIAEIFDAILLVGEAYWRVCGHTRVNDALEAWLSHQEPARID